MAITAKLVSELRAKTGAGMMDCKKALVENDGDMTKAGRVPSEEESRSCRQALWQSRR